MHSSGLLSNNHRPFTPEGAVSPKEMICGQCLPFMIFLISRPGPPGNRKVTNVAHDAKFVKEHYALNCNIHSIKPSSFEFLRKVAYTRPQIVEADSGDRPHSKRNTRKESRVTTKVGPHTIKWKRTIVPSCEAHRHFRFLLLAQGAQAQKLHATKTNLRSYSDGPEPAPFLNFPN